jgi:CubicO group peptidase (beta-lactamase class C family)
MKPRSLALLFVVQVLSLALPTAVGLQDPSLAPTKIERVHELIQRATEKFKAPGATFAIGLADKVVWSEGFGFADLENQIAARPDTTYRTASIGKAMTATAALKLAEQGKLDLDAPIQRYCPSFPKQYADHRAI